jgi:hypothetical protein
MCGVGLGPLAPAEATPTARLLATHRVFERPVPSSRQKPPVSGRRPITGKRTVLPILGQRLQGFGGRWLRVALPGRPNGSSGWIRAAKTRLASSEWRIVVALRQRRVTVWRGGRSIRTFRAVVGAPATPTPTGRFFVEESVALAPGLVGSPVALALSARSNVLRQFAGGPGQIAIHGRGGIGGSLGTAVSHGCIRLSHHAVAWLARHVGAGVRVRIRPSSRT